MILIIEIIPNFKIHINYTIVVANKVIILTINQYNYLLSNN